MKICTVCLKPKRRTINNWKPKKRTSDGLSFYCRECHRKIDREYRRNWRKENSEEKRKEDNEYAKKYPERIKAMRMALRAEKKELLVKRPCRCGREDVHKHHPNYQYPLKVIYLCPACHKKAHQTRRNAPKNDLITK